MVMYILIIKNPSANIYTVIGGKNQLIFFGTFGKCYACGIEGRLVKRTLYRF
jgi:hypothetical protein